MKNFMRLCLGRSAAGSISNERGITYIAACTNEATYSKCMYCSRIYIYRLLNGYDAHTVCVQCQTTIAKMIMHTTVNQLQLSAVKRQL